MRHILVAVVTMILLLSPPLTAGDGSAFAPHGLNPLHAEAEYPIPGGGHPLLFCGDKFISLLVVGFLNSNVQHVIPLGEPSMNAFRKSDIERVLMPSGMNTRIFVATLGENYYGVETWTDARAILECLD